MQGAAEDGGDDDWLGQGPEQSQAFATGHPPATHHQHPLATKIKVEGEKAHGLYSTHSIGSVNILDNVAMAKRKA